MSDHTHTHSHGHEHHRHGHNHQHGEDKAHTHSSSNTTDQWVGKDYLNQPGLYVFLSRCSAILIDSRELAQTNHDTTVRALASAGISEDKISTLNLLEVGCGEFSSANLTKLISRCRSSNSVILEIIQIRPRNRRFSIHVIDFLNRVTIR